MNSALTADTYNYKVVRQFAVMTVVWGIVGMLVGVIIAAQLAWPDLNFGVPWLSFGRLRPLHTNAVIFAFGGCALFATSYYVVQRTCQVRLFSRPARRVHLLGLAGRSSSPRRSRCRWACTTGKEYAELEWPIDILITLVWVAYAVVFFGTHRQAQGQAHLRRQLVLRRVHPHGRAAAHRQQRRRSRSDLWKSYSVYAGRAGRDGAVVVRPQRGRLLPDRRLPRDDVLLRPEAGRAAGLLLPAVGRALLGADLHLHVGRPAPPALHRAARLDAVARHGVLADPARAVAGAA